MSELSKKFKQALAVNTAIALAATGTACAKNEENEKEPNKENNYINATIQSNENHGNSEYLEKDEIFIEYSYIKNKLKDKENLSKEEMLAIGNSYKKIISSINYIDYVVNENNETYVIDEFPKMSDLYTDMQEKVIDLMCDNAILKMPDGSVEFQEELIMENYLIATDQTPLEDVKIVQLEENKYSILSGEGEFYFDIYIYGRRGRNMYITKN